MTNVGPYELVRLVAITTTGQLWKARDTELTRDVALKLAGPQVPGAVERLRAEARTLAGLQHPNIVTVYDLIDNEDASAWLIEEWVEGAELQVVLADAGQLTAPQALGVVRGALLGLSYTHQRRIVHGDLSPANILLDTEGTSKLIDFGLAAPAGATGVAGTPGYLSPETLQSAPVTARSDVYSAAAVLAMLLRGRPLFDGPSAEAVVAVQLKTSSPNLTGIQGGVREVLARALATRAADRYEDAAEFLRALEQAAEDDCGAGWLAQAGVAGLVAATITATATMAASGVGAGAVAGQATSTAATVVPGHVAAGTAEGASAPAVGAPGVPSVVAHAAGAIHSPGELAASAASSGDGVDRLAADRAHPRGKRRLSPRVAVAAGVGVLVVAAAAAAIATHHSPHKKPAAGPVPAADLTATVPGGTVPSGVSSSPNAGLAPLTKDPCTFLSQAQVTKIVNTVGEGYTVVGSPTHTSSEDDTVQPTRDCKWTWRAQRGPDGTVEDGAADVNVSYRRLLQIGTTPDVCTGTGVVSVAGVGDHAQVGDGVGCTESSSQNVFLEVLFDGTVGGSGKTVYRGLFSPLLIAALANAGTG